MALCAMMFFMMALLPTGSLERILQSLQLLGAAVASQSRMLFGEYLYAENADELSGVMLAMYCFFFNAFTFMLDAVSVLAPVVTSYVLPSVL